jgi:hypothetical protein
MLTTQKAAIRLKIARDKLFCEKLLYLGISLIRDDSTFSDRCKNKGLIFFALNPDSRRQ